MFGDENQRIFIGRSVRFEHLFVLFFIVIHQFTNSRQYCNIIIIFIIIIVVVAQNDIGFVLFAFAKIDAFSSVSNYSFKSDNINGHNYRRSDGQTDVNYERSDNRAKYEQRVRRRSEQCFLLLQRLFACRLTFNQLVVFLT